MRKIASAVLILFLALVIFGFKLHYTADPVPNSEAEAPKRPFYKYPGDYGEEVRKLMDRFKKAFGYDLVEFGEAWRTDQIEKLHGAFSQLPPTFHQLPGMKGLYRLSRIMVGAGKVSEDEIPAATFPTFVTIYEAESKSYKVFVDDQDPRVEFYTPLFYEDTDDFNNIVQHEMAHAFDLTNGFLSFSKEWVALTKFRIMNMPALDAKPGSNFLYTFLNDPNVDNYAPVSLRHLPTYSRQNVQEDFANSVAAYIHYPYFQYTHPARYRFLKERVFGGKEYFPHDDSAVSFDKKALADFNEAAEKKDWNRITVIFQEVSRGHYPALEAELTRRLDEVIGSEPSAEKDLQLTLASCYLMDPEALELRKKLVREKRIETEKLAKNERCFRISQDNFQRNLAKWPPANAIFFRENGRDMLQFLDPVLGVAHARGFNTRYLWRITVEGSAATAPLAEGKLTIAEGGHGAVKLDLQKTAEKDFTLPEGKNLILELGVNRMHPRTFKVYDSEISRIRFVVQPWLNYVGPEKPEIRVMYPFRAAYKRQN